MLRCVICKTDFANPPTSKCQGGGNHVLQEVVVGDFSPDTKSECDFVSVDSSDLRKWGEQAKKIFGDDQ